MKPALRERIIAFNKSMNERKEKAMDMDALVDKIARLPYGQMKKVLTEDVLEILEKYGIGKEAV